jgi:hypothetical protein
MGELGPGSLRLNVLSRVNLTREELRYARSYAVGMVLEVDRGKAAQGLQKGRYTVIAADPSRERVMLRERAGQALRISAGPDAAAR